MCSGLGPDPVTHRGSHMFYFLLLLLDISAYFYTGNILTAGLLFVAEYVHSFVLELLLSQLLKDLWLNGRHKNTSHHLNHTWLEDSESGWYLDCDWWFRSPQEQEHKYGRENCNKVLQSLHVFWTDCDKKSNLPSNHLVISQTDKTTSDYYWDTWREQSRIHFTVTAVKKACSCHRGKTNPRATPGGEKWHQINFNKGEQSPLVTSQFVHPHFPLHPSSCHSPFLMRREQRTQEETRGERS